VTMKKTLSRLLYRLIRFLVWLFYPKMQIIGAEHLPEGSCIVVGNHAKMNGPIACELYFPRPRCTWCAGEMMHLREVPAYAYRDFWSHKPKAVRWFFRMLSYLIAPISVCVFNNAECIGVYHDMRLMNTFQETVDRLQSGVDVVIFPEHDVPYNGVVWEFQDRFIDVARLYCRRSGQPISFVPLYVAPRLHTLSLGEPIRFDPAAPPAEERRRICTALMDGVTALARALPEHIVVPYPNVPKRDYPLNKETSAS